MLKELKNISYFVLYDMEDYPICYYSNLEELLEHINYNRYELVRQFKKFGNSIKLVIGNQFYKLYKFVD